MRQAGIRTEMQNIAVKTILLATVFVSGCASDFIEVRDKDTVTGAGRLQVEIIKGKVWRVTDSEQPESGAWIKIIKKQKFSRRDIVTVTSGDILYIKKDSRIRLARAPGSSVSMEKKAGSWLEFR